MVVLLKQARLLSCWVLLLVSVSPLYAETVEVKYRGPVDLAKFECSGELDSSVVKRVCYNAEHSYMLIRLKQTWYHYCEIDQGTVSALLAAESKGRFYNSSIKDSGTDSKFSCRDKPVPDL
ncbi:KTSC domain-containing protein [Mesorhizobium sp. BR1-1-13]|uniref:KTSC domain-containing protein n=1 Tax=Mesorhizobium sp. BR1-1-13 TaxID=2876656 RepID=UPI001CD045FB|nr:KTSC domain-containing protein [Mesorhizobium sp. BR1-1-13]MBZ9942651.1 KTSC domain-containing protein [Mesorhizobium sp. BR1-1-13]